MAWSGSSAILGRVTLARARGIRKARLGKSHGMLAILAAIVFGIAFVFNATGRVTDRIFSVTGLLILGLILLALQLALTGGVWVRRR